MPKQSFSCVLNQHYKDALPKTAQKVSLETLAEYFEVDVSEIRNREEIYLGDYQYYMEDDTCDQYGGTNCCGIDELIFEGIIDRVRRNDKVTRQLVANHIRKCYNNDRRVLIVGLPLRKSNGGPSQYTFGNYKVLRKILLKFGFVQTHTRPYKNANSNNMLSVLVGQFP